MNASDSDAQADLPLDSPSAEAPAPKRRRTVAKAEAAAPEGADAAEAAPAVKRPRRKAASADAAETAAAPEAAAEASAEPAPKKRAPRKKAEAEVPAEPAAEAPAAPAPVVAVQPEPAAEAAAESGGDQGDEGEDGDEGEGEDGEGGGRRRNRRRNRKERAERLAAAIASGEVVVPVASLTPEVAAATGARFEDVLSGGLDAESESAEELAVEVVHMSDADAEAADDEAEEGDEDAAGDGKRILAPEADAPKLQKVLAQSGIGSRRDIEAWIAEGRIEVNGEVAHVGQRVSFGDQVKVNGKPVRIRIAPPNSRILAYHKPTGEVSTFHDPEGRPTVFRTLPKVQGCKWQSVGRLDINTEGLLLFTNSGELANQLMHPRFGVEREYAARVLGSLSEEQRAKLLEGVSVDGQAAAFRSITDGGGEGANRWYRVVITEGRNREVRKLFEAVGMVVSRLIRIRYGTVVLPRGLKRGQWVELGEADVRVIKRLAGGPQQQQQQQAPHGPKARDDKPGRNRNDRRPDRNAGSGPRPSRPPEKVERERFEDRPPRQERRDEDEDDFIPHHINPLEQTFDRRHASSGKRGFPQGFGAGGSGQQQQRGKPQKGGGGGNGPREPDPMQTSMGYIGGDAFLRRNKGGKGGGGGGGGRSGGGFGGRHR